LAERDQHRQQVAALVGEAIGDLAPVDGVRLAPQDAVLDQPREAVGKNVAGDAEGRLELLEMDEAVERGAQDQERPALAHRLQRGGDRALPEQAALTFDIQHFPGA
jgi:hypothetical protein